MALSLLCGGLGVASAADSTVHVDASTTPSNATEVYTTTGVNTLLADYGKKTDVETNKNDITALRTTTTDQGKLITENATNIARNTADIEKKIDRETANATYATKDALRNLNDTVDDKADEAAVTTALDGKADKTAVTALEGRVSGVEERVTTLEGTVGNATIGLVKDVADLKNQVNTELGTKANQSDLVAATNRITANEGNITALQKKTAKLSDDGMKLTGMTAVGGATVSGTTVNARALKVTGKISDGTVKTTLAEIDASMKQTETNKADIVNLKTTTGEQDTAIKDLQKKTTNISYADGAGTSIDGITVKDGNIVGNGNSAITGITNITTDNINGKSLAGTTVATVKEVTDAVESEKTERENADKALSDRIGNLTGDKNYIKKGMNVSDNLVELDTRAKTNADNIQTNANNIKNNKDEIARVNGELVKTNDYFNKELGKTNDYFNTELSKTNNHFNTELGKTNAALQEEGKARAEADAKINTKIGNIDDTRTEYVKNANSISQNLTTLDEKLQATNDRTGGIKRNTEDTQTTIEDKVTVNSSGDVGGVKGLSAETINTTGDAAIGGKLNVTGASDLKGDVILGTPNGTNTVTVNGTANFYAAANMNKGLNVTSGDTDLKNTTVDGTLSVNKETTLKKTDVNGALTVQGEATFTKKVTMENDLEVKGELKTDKIAMENKKTDPDGTIHRSATTITADGITHIGEVEKSGVITKSQFTHTEEGSETYATKGDKTDWTETRSDVKADGVKTEVKDSKGNRTNTSQTTEVINGFAIDEDGNSSTTSQTAKDINGNVTDKDGNKTDMKVTATENSIQIQDKDGKNTNHQVNTMGSSVTEIKNGDGKTTKTEQTATDIINTAKDGIIKNEANHIENTATTMKTTVTGQATEEFNGGLDTTVAGTEKHTVNGKQINTVTEGQENIISGGQTNTITGGQINNITGDQTTTITGNKTETVTENVTEDYKKDLTTTVGGNETHEVKGTKTETVEGKVTENFKNGQETNVTGDQVIKVSGTQTTTATDINRNASSGMIDTIDNDYGTNTETKVAGKTTTDVSIKGTEEKGQYIRGANESRDYLIKGTLKNSETKTAEATSTEITDGNGKTSATIQDVNNLAGSVTNGTETGVSGIHANDNSVSIDSIVTDGNKYSVINQKKGSIQSTVVDGTNSTVILQDKDNVTIASSNGTVGIVGKDIVNNAQNTITNTAGTKITDKVGENTRVTTSTSITDTVGTANRKIEDGKITDTAGDSTVTTENKKGTTFTKTGSTAYSTEAGAPTDTNIAGNHITTGRVDVNELGVSDKDDQGNTADFSVKAGEGIKGSATDKDGNKTSTKVTATENSFQVQDKDGKIKNHQVNTKDSSENTITNGDKTNTVTSTADGTTFNNSGAAARVNGDGTYLNTTIKGNTITTGKVTMDYAEVMKDLGVNRNANIGGKTTTGSLEVKGESKLTGNVTMENNATVGNDLTVKGITTTKTLKVTENAEINGNATIKGDVTAKSYKVGDKTYINADGINANNQKITNVADGSISEGSKDAVNGGQLYSVKNDLEGKVNKVGANAAAMANLHPMEFDPDSKWNIAAAIGNYGSETAAALGAFYRPNDDVMVNLSTAFGTGENMVGGGVSVRLGKGGNKLSREESNALKAQVNDLTARMDALLSVLNPNMSKDFPDVPENHWAYEAVSRLAGNDIVQGYPDGEFHGERTMTRYEMAEIIYNALSRGAEAEKELVEEFKPELQAMAASEKATAERAEG